MKSERAQIQKKQGEIVMPIDKLTQNLSSFDKDAYAEAVKDGGANFVKEKEVKGKPTIKTPFYLKQKAGLNDLTPLRWFDIGVVAVSSTYFQQGGEVLTFDMILRALTGEKRIFTDEQRRAVRDSVIRCMETTITVEMEETCRKMKGYKTDKPKVTGAILPCKLLEDVIINGQKTSAIKILDESPLMEIAGIKKQFLTMDTSLLAVPTLKNTPRIMGVKLYVTTFALIIARSLRNKRKNTPDTLTFQKIYESVDAGDETRAVKYNIREAAIKVVEHLKAQEAIRDFEIVKDDGRIHAIKILV